MALLLSMQLYAQSNGNLWWISVYEGFALSEDGKLSDVLYNQATGKYFPDTAGMDIFLEYSYLFTGNGLLLSGNIEINPAIAIFGKPIEEKLFLNALIGKCFKARYGYCSISTGIGYVWGDYYTVTDSRYEKFAGITWPTEIQVIFTPFRFFGIGLYAIFNGNDYRVNKGFGMEYQFGKLYNKRR